MYAPHWSADPSQFVAFCYIRHYHSAEVFRVVFEKPGK
jgi:hypothetical protein